jgi:hypothetical protein
MFSSKKYRYAEMYLLILGGVYLCYHGGVSISHGLVSTLVAPVNSLYAAYILVRRLLFMTFPMVIGIGLLAIAYSKTIESIKGNMDKSH